MATIFYVEHKAADGTIYRREPAGSLHEAREVLFGILNDAEDIGAGDVFTVVDASDDPADK